MRTVLLIAEKPSVMKAIQVVCRNVNLGMKIECIALLGHVVELCYPQDYEAAWGKPWTKDVLPMIPTIFRYKEMERGGDNEHIRKAFQNAKTHLLDSRYEYVINACDAGREGELIFQAVYQLTGSTLPIKRLWISDTTEATIEKGLRHLIDGEDAQLQRLKKTAEFRAQFDWLIGMNLSRAVTLNAQANVAVGRVMTPTLALIVRREWSIQRFVPQAYALIEGEFEGYTGIWVDRERERGERIFSTDDLQCILKRLKPSVARVGRVETNRETVHAPTLHSLTELQREANRVFG